MAWVAISNTAIDQDSPITTSLITALRDNVTALANGDAGAPRIQTAALNDLCVTTAKYNNNSITNGKLQDGCLSMGKFPAPSAGDTYVLWRVRYDRPAGSGDDSGTHNFVVTRSGTIRIYARGDTSSTVAISRNGTLVTTLSTYTTGTPQTYDLSVSSGDTVTLYYNSVGEEEWVDVRIYNGQPFPFYVIEQY